MPWSSGSPQGVFAGVYSFAALATGFDDVVCAASGATSSAETAIITVTMLITTNSFFIGYFLPEARRSFEPYTPKRSARVIFRPQFSRATLAGPSPDSPCIPAAYGVCTSIGCGSERHQVTGFRQLLELICERS